MATPFTDIYARAIFRFADYKFLQQDIDVREGVLEKYLMSAKTDFAHMCKYNLEDCDMVAKQFNQTLGNEEMEILALGVAYYWVSYKALNSELLKNVLNGKDYYYYSPANLLKEVQTLRKTIGDEFRSRMNAYSFREGQISTVRP